MNLASSPAELQDIVTYWYWKQIVSLQVILWTNNILWEVKSFQREIYRSLKLLLPSSVIGKSRGLQSIVSSYRLLTSPWRILSMFFLFLTRTWAQLKHLSPSFANASTSEKSSLAKSTLWTKILSCELQSNKEASDKNKILATLWLEKCLEFSPIKNVQLMCWNSQSPSKPGHFILIDFHPSPFLLPFQVHKKNRW